MNFKSKFVYIVPFIAIYLAMNAFKGLAMGGAADFDPWFSVIALFSSGILAFGAAVFLFSWDSRNTTRRGHPILALVFLLPFVLSMLIG